MLYFCAADVKIFYESSPLHSNYASSYHSHALIFSHCDGDQEERVAWISVVRLRSVNNHNVQDLYMETSQLPSSTMPVICPTVNQTVKQAPLLSCLTYWVQHKARSSLYVLWCGIIWDGGGGWGGDHFELLLSSCSPLFWPMCLRSCRGYVFCYCALHQIRMTLWQDFFLCYNERLKEPEKKKRWEEHSARMY